MSKVKEFMSPEDYKGVKTKIRIIEDGIKLIDKAFDEESQAFLIFKRDYKGVEVNAVCPDCGDMCDKLYEEPGNKSTFNQFSCEECIVERIKEDLIEQDE